MSILLLVFFVGAAAFGGVADFDEVSSEGRRVTVVQIDGIIQPVVAEFILEQLEESGQRGDELFVIELSTPGGMLGSTRRITSAMLEAKTPSVAFVYPQGVHAASAGFFVLMAADIAAMAPATNTGAAHPVTGRGEDIDGDMGEKVSQDTAAMIRALAASRGRDQDLAESAVLESRSFSASEALEFGLIDEIAVDLDALLSRLDKRTLDRGEHQRRLELESARVVHVKMSLFQRIRSAIVHPDIAYMLLSLGGLGLYFEFSNPGASFPGVLGAICVVLGLYGTSVLPVNYAGLALMGLSSFFFVAELKVPSFGLFTLGGVTSLVLGSLMLFRTADPALRVSGQLIVALAVVALLTVGVLSALVLRSRKTRVMTGAEGLVQEIGAARMAFGPDLEGKVFLHGELWNAISSSQIEEGEEIEVLAVNGLTLTVGPRSRS